MKTLILSLIAVAALGAPGQKGTLLPSCSPCIVGESVVFVGTGYQKNVQLSLLWWQHSRYQICSSDSYGVLTCQPFQLQEVGLNSFQIYNADGTQPRSPIVSIEVE